MTIEFRVGEYYTAKTYKESGFNFPEGEYKLKIIRERFPESPVMEENELIIAKEQWLEGIEGTKQYRIAVSYTHLTLPTNREV